LSRKKLLVVLVAVCVRYIAYHNVALDGGIFERSGVSGLNLDLDS
jgi:hypothetical protein